MAREDSERLKAANPDPRRACRVEETPPELAKMIAAGLDRIIDRAEDGDRK